jgi:hypothetical protein
MVASSQARSGRPATKAHAEKRKARPQLFGRGNPASITHEGQEQAPSRRRSPSTQAARRLIACSSHAHRNSCIIVVVVDGVVDVDEVDEALLGPSRKLDAMLQNVRCETHAEGMLTA